MEAYRWTPVLYTDNDAVTLKNLFLIFALPEAFVPCTLLQRRYFDRDQDSLVLLC